jgi:hypothetical protein
VSPSAEPRREARPPRRRGGLLLLLALVAVLAWLLGRCQGFGLGPGGGLGGGDGAGRGDGEGDGGRAGAAGGRAPDVDAGPRRCRLRLDAAGLTRDGRPLAIADAITACRPAGAEVVVTGDARQGALDALREAFATAGVSLLTP